VTALVSVLADADAVQMLTRNTQVGEFYYMHPPKSMGREWQPNMLDMIIYDEEADKHVRISWEDAMNATFVDDAGLIDHTGVQVALATEDDGDQTKTTLVWHQKCEAWNEFNKTGLLADTHTNIGLTTAPVNSKAAFDELTKYDQSGDGSGDGKGTPYIAVTRPFIEHMMHSVILTVSGRDTGATLFGPADMQLSANTQVKTIEGYACPPPPLVRTHSRAHEFKLTHAHTPASTLHPSQYASAATTRATSRR
tara:strand:+ start:256 stop:1011 length:756 start_codon:yes stop_codon:yes gene_type:complete